MFGGKFTVTAVKGGSTALALLPSHIPIHDPSRTCCEYLVSSSSHYLHIYIPTHPFSAVRSAVLRKNLGVSSIL